MNSTKPVKRVRAKGPIALLHCFDMVKEFREEEGYVSVGPKSFLKILERVADDELTLRIFERTGGDYRNASDWYEVLVAVATYLFDRTPNGRPREFEPPARRVLEADFIACAKLPEYVGKNAITIFEAMIASNPRKYRNAKPENLQKIVNKLGLTAGGMKRQARLKKPSRGKSGRQLKA